VAGIPFPSNNRGNTFEIQKVVISGADQGYTNDLSPGGKVLATMEFNPFDPDIDIPAGQAPAVDPTLEETLALEGLSPDRVGQGSHLGCPERLSHGNQLEEGTLVAREVREASLDQLDQPLGWDQRPRQSPQLSVVGQSTGAEGTENQLTQEQGVALGAGGKPRHRGGLEGAAQSGGEELSHGVGGQALEVDPLGQALLPEGDYGIGSGLAGAQGGKHEGGARLGELVRQRGRGVVEKVGVVDEEDQSLAVAPLRQGRAAPPEEAGLVLGCFRVNVPDRREQWGEGPERQMGGRSGGCRPGGRQACAFGFCQALGGQATLSDPRRPGEHRAPPRW